MKKKNYKAILATVHSAPGMNILQINSQKKSNQFDNLKKKHYIWSFLKKRPKSTKKYENLQKVPKNTKKYKKSTKKVPKQYQKINSTKHQKKIQH